MGLDMYAYALEGSKTRKRTFDNDFDPRSLGEVREFYYWRKCSEIHSWMEDLYYAKGGTAPDFNCVGVFLTAKDLDVFEKDFTEGNFEYRPGFFFGDKNEDSFIRESAKKFLDLARWEIKHGNKVFYSSWW